ncbi:MAG TPA: response regulator transcription factor [Anaerolineae bacterium]|nr:response regulator transcription factor [Anaerolineae bacterium]MCB0178290.1 response regulator transcription factor [Anaerolineae bacterium]MCB9107897.1 response regulator transcription factor [Anaerolineales bacterium]HRV95917.1 response regulator transcription factor [Anaerolineae bacterium]
MTVIRVLIAEDQTIWREIYCRVIEEAPGTELVAAVADGQAAVAAARELKPDVMLLDIQMPQLNGIEAAKQIRAMLPEVGLILISHHAQRQYAEVFLRNGTSGKAYLLKHTLNEPVELIRAIEVVAEGGAMLAPEIQDELLQLASAAPYAQLNELTKREKEVLGLMAEGYTNVSIANKLSVSERTVESHVNNIFSKLGLSSEATRNPRVMAVLLFLQAGQ